MNCNTTQSMTDAIGRAAQEAASEGTQVLAMQPRWGPTSAEGYFDSYLTAAAVLDLLTDLDQRYDALVMAGFGEHGREGARELLDVPVVDVTEAGAHLAMMLGRRYGVVTTLDRAIPQIEDSLTLAGVRRGCASIQSANLGVLEIEEDRELTMASLEAASQRALSDGAEVIVLGCAGMTDLGKELSVRLGVPVIDVVQAAVRMAETYVALGLSTSKLRAYARPRSKARPGWPITAPAVL